MEFYLSFADLFEKFPNKIAVIFIPAGRRPPERCWPKSAILPA
jgi:hypothetical protein